MSSVPSARSWPRAVSAFSPRRRPRRRPSGTRSWPRGGVPRSCTSQRTRSRCPSSPTSSSIPACPGVRSRCCATLGEQLEGQSVSVILTDASGLVLTRITGDRALESHLDRVLLAPGFSYAEKFVGTNGIGTALEMGGPAHVFGHEHYAEHLEDLACAGVPIHHPITGRLVGAVDFTCWRRDAGALLLTLAKTTAEQIRQSLLADAGSSELGLFREYLRTCGRGARHRLRPEQRRGDVERLRPDGARSSRPGGAPRPGQRDPDERARRLLVVDLPSGQTARMYSRPVDAGDWPAGIVAHVKLDPADRGHRDCATDGPPAASRHRRLRSAVAQRLRGGRAGFPLGRVAGGGGRARESGNWLSSPPSSCVGNRSAASWSMDALDDAA